MRRVSQVALVFVGAFLMAPSAADAVVLNDKAADDAGGISNYFDRDNVYSNVVFLNSPAGICTGTLINARTILTAAHCVTDKNGAILADPLSTVEFSPDADAPTERYTFMNGVSLHPGFEYLEMTNDIALISLQVPLAEYTPVRLIGRNDAMPAIGTVVRFVGYGATGTGSSAPDHSGPYDYKRRVGETILGGYGLNLAGQTYIIGEFTDPSGPLPPGTKLPPLQGGLASGDSGGPLFMVTADGLVQIGIASWVDNDLDKPRFGYGSQTGWTKVTDYLDWIEANDPLRNVAAVGGNFRWSDKAAWRDPGGLAATVPNNRGGGFEGFGTTGRYYNVTLAKAGTITVDMDPYVDNVFVDHRDARLVVAPKTLLDVWGGIEVTDGYVAVDGTINSGYLVTLGGSLTGTGTIIAYDAVHNLSGTVTPGGANTVGTLTVDGRYRQYEDGTLAIRLSKDGSDRLAVTGEAQLEGRLHLGGSDVYDGQRAVVLTADTISGKFAQTTDAFAFFDASLAYSAQAVTADIFRNGRSFADAALFANDKRAATAVESLGPGNALHDAALQLQETETARAFDSLSGDIHASARSVLLDTSRYTRDAITDRLRQAFEGTAVGSEPQTKSLSNTDLALWTQALGSWERFDNNGDVADLDAHTGGLLLGADLPFDTWRLGIAGGYSRTSMDSNGTAASASTDNYHAAIYGGTQAGALGVRLGGAIAWHQIDTTRSINLSEYSDSLTGSENALTAQTFAELGYKLTVDRFVLEPFAGLAYVHLDADGFTEQGGAAALRGFAGNADTGFTSLGLRGETRIELHDRSSLRLSSAIGWRHAFGDIEPETALAFAGGPGLPFGAAGAPLDRNALVVEAGIGFDSGHGGRLGFNYAGQFAAGTQAQTLKADFSWSF